MNIKWNWGTGIVIAFILFIIFIMQYVYRVSVMDEYNHHLVTEEYYEEELNYQEEIDKVNKANSLPENVKVIHAGKGILIKFPKGLEEDKISGTVQFKRLSNHKLDFSKDIELTDHALFIPDNILVSGKWVIKVDWEFDGNEYLLKENIFY
ncbi:MAG: FixH family protein [Bacteroidota bacterium]